MTSRQCTDEAKILVLSHGASTCLEFTTELVQQDLFALDAQHGDQWRIRHGITLGELSRAVVHQSERVYRLLGYIPTGGFTP